MCGPRFALGQDICTRIVGLPMGGLLSEPLLLVDAGVHINYLHKHRSLETVTCLAGVPRCDDGIELADILAGLMHVDDICLFS
jgi:hypothetical protein